MDVLVVAFYFIALPCLSFGCGALALWAAWRGHWSALILALPPLLVGGGFLFTMISGPSGVSMNLLGYFLHAVLPMPLLIGLAAVGLWFRQRGRAMNSAEISAK